MPCKEARCHTLFRIQTGRSLHNRWAESITQNLILFRNYAKNVKRQRWARSNCLSEACQYQNYNRVSKNKGRMRRLRAQICLQEPSIQQEKPEEAEMARSRSRKLSQHNSLGKKWKSWRLNLRLCKSLGWTSHLWNRHFRKESKFIAMRRRSVPQARVPNW